MSDLNNDDTIITFNYDPVLEKLNNDDGRLRFMVPSMDLKRSEPESRMVDVYKLHGSVTWKREGKTILQQADLEFAAKCDPGELAIATPGASKHLAVYDLFMPLWNHAEQAIKQADAIVFIGYRFPPSDAYSRERLLTAIWGNRRSRLKTFIVLGPIVQHEDVVRLKAMLEWTIDNSPVPRGPHQSWVHPLYSEDYFTVWKLDAATRELRGQPGDKV